MPSSVCILDTSVLLSEGRRALYLFGKDSEVIIPLIAVRELEGKRHHADLGHNARAVLRELWSLAVCGSLQDGVYRNGTIVKVELGNITHRNMTIVEDKVSSINDTKIMAVARNYTDTYGDDATLYTKDIPLAILANLVGIKASDLPYVSDNDVHAPIKTYTVSDEDLSTLYGEGSVRLDLDVPINSGVILKSDNGSALAIHCRSYEFQLVGDQNVFGVNGRSAPQTVALRQLTDPNIRAVSLGGRAGTGKTLIALAAGIQAVKDGSNPVDRVVVFRNMYAVGDQELGFLPGTEAEKMDPWTAAVWDAVKSIPGLTESQVRDLKNSKKVEVLPITHIRGRTFHNTYIIVDEAQNLTRDTIKTILTRAGTNTKVALTHDISQRDNLRVGRYEGIFEVVSRMQGSKLFAHTTLTKSERSDLSEVASELLDD